MGVVRDEKQPACAALQRGIRFVRCIAIALQLDFAESKISESGWGD